MSDSHHAAPNASGSSSVLIALVVGLVIYGAAAVIGWPQHGTELILAGGDHHAEAADAAEAVPEPHAAKPPAPPLWTVTPFVLLLGAIAIFPLLHKTEHWWESNANRFKVAAGLGLLTLLYYLVLHKHPVEGHWPAHHLVESAAGGLNFGVVAALLQNAMLGEYIPFIVLLFSLYTISGGIRITGDLQANPVTNMLVHGGGGAAGQLHRHHRRRDAAHSAAAGDQPRAKARRPHGGVLHLHRLQLRRVLAADWRSAAVSGLLARRRFLLDA